MAFIWVATITAGNKIIEDAITEVRTNTDWLDNNLDYCSTHHVTYQSGHLVGYDATHYPGYLNNDHITHLSGHDTGQDAAHYPG